MVQLFVTGTDTGVGKTHVATALCRAGVERGWKVFGHKPVETGCKIVGGHKVADDALALAEASGGWQGGDLVCQYMLEQAAAPAVAARRENVFIDINRIVATIQRVCANRQLTVIEGAGGWRVPLTDNEEMSGLAQRLEFPVLVVARAGLGTINHSLLTVEAVEYDGCEVWGIALSVAPSDDVDLARSNRDEIAQRSGCPVWIFEPGAVLDRVNAA